MTPLFHEFATKTSKSSHKSPLGGVAELGSTVVSPSSPSAITYFKFRVIFRRSLIMIHYVWYSLYQ